MAMLSVVIIGVIAFTGLLVGMLLRHLASEEVAAGARYLRAFQYALLFLLMILLLSRASLSFPVLLSFALGFTLSFLVRIRYLFLGLALAASLSQPLFFVLLVGSLIFLYGLPFGSLFPLNVPSIVFTAVLFVLPFALAWVPFSSDLLLAFSAGTLFLRQ